MAADRKKVMNAKKKRAKKAVGKRQAFPFAENGREMYGWAADLFPLPRSLTGPGVRATLEYIKRRLPALQIHSVPSGTRAFDWTVPDEWTIRDAFVADESGKRLIDFRAHNLHVVGYSEPVDRWLTLDELQPYLHSLPEQPNAIPYLTSYYKRQWGFCLSDKLRKRLKPGRYHVMIDSDLKPGVMNYGELVLPGKEDREILLSTYICHPSMANNELSGPVVVTALARELTARSDRRLGYRIIFVPETIGAIVYISRHLDRLKQSVIAGFVVTCVGDERAYSFLGSRRGNTLSDRIAHHILDRSVGSYDHYSFLDRGSDERQYGSPLVDLPVVSIMRSKYGTGNYPEYHTSLDNMSLITPRGLADSYAILSKCIRGLELNRTYRAVFPCEPQLSPRDLYPTFSTRDSGRSVRDMMNVLAYADGKNDLISIAEIIGVDVFKCSEIANKLCAAGVLTTV